MLLAPVEVEKLMREFVGYLSATVPELRNVEVPVLGQHLENFLEIKKRD